MRTRRTLRCFGGPLHDQVVTTDADPFLAPVPTRVTWSIDPPVDPPEIGLDVVLYHHAAAWVHDPINCQFKDAPRRVRNVMCRDSACSFIARYAVVEGGDPQEAVDVMKGLYWLTTRAIGAVWGRRRENADRIAARAWSGYMDRVRDGSMTLDGANRLADADHRIAPR